MGGLPPNKLIQFNTTNDIVSVTRGVNLMDLKDMIITIVYLSPEGLSPLEIVERVGHQFCIETTTKKVLQIVEANPKLFIEVQGKIKSPSNRGLK